MTWNYRIMKRASKVGRKINIWYGLYEVYYRKDKKPYMCTEEPEVIGDTPAEVVECLAMMLRDATKVNVPVLDYDNPPWKNKSRKAPVKGKKR